MCGRYALAQAHEALKLRYGFADDDASTYRQTPRYNIAPTQIAAVITNGQETALRPMRWGLIPHWAKDPSIGNSLINARSETAAEKPSFRDSFRMKRCLVPATGFYEWKKLPQSKSKQPTFIRCKDQEIFSLAGLWALWRDPETDIETYTYTILTTSPNDLMKEIHNRMPVILSPDSERLWLDLATDRETIDKLLSPCPSELLEAFPVSTVVNSPRNDSPECITPL